MFGNFKLNNVNYVNVRKLPHLVLLVTDLFDEVASEEWVDEEGMDIHGDTCSKDNSLTWIYGGVLCWWKPPHHLCQEDCGILLCPRVLFLMHQFMEINRHIRETREHL